MYKLILPAIVFALTLHGQSLDSATAAKCTALQKTAIPDLIITEARPVQEAKLPPFCMVHGTIDQRKGVGGVTFGIGFELRLPANYTGRFLFQGGGGMDGVVRPALGNASAANANPGLARGFAVVSTDAGHQGTSNADASFSRDQQARIDNAYRSIDRVTMISKAIIQQYYGQPWKRAYFDGCSNGGRQGLIAAQRYPTYFDGIVAGAPAFRVTRAAVGSAWETRMFNQIAPKDDSGKAILSKAYSQSDLTLVANAILEKCDALDGVKDGLVFNTKACKFDPAPLTCKGGKTEACISQDQVSVLQKTFSGAVNSQQQALYSDWPWDPGIASPGWRMLKLGTSTTPEPNSADVTLMLSGLKGYFMTPYNASFDPMKFDFDRDYARVQETAALQDAEMTELSTFISSGRKLLLYHGVADPFFSSNDTQRYYERLLADNQNAGKDWAKFFLIPGMTHCGGGPALDNFDALGALVDWVEQGKTPEQMNSTGAAFPGRSRPVCAYPKFAMYKGTGSTEDGANFECR